MNIGEKFYCSRCMAELKEEGKCNSCDYNPSESADPCALEEGALLKGIRFQIGAVRERTDMYYIYGAYDYLKQEPVYILEIYPNIGLQRIDDIICTNSLELQKNFDEIKNRAISSIALLYEKFEFNNTVYFCIPMNEPKENSVLAIKAILI